MRRPARRRRRQVGGRAVWLVAGVIAAAAAALAVAVLWWSGATLALDRVALARVEVQPLGGSLISARAFAPDGTGIPLSVSGGRLLPRRLLTPGESVTVITVVRRPGWLGWALGHTRTGAADRSCTASSAFATLADGRYSLRAAVAVRRAGRPGLVPEWRPRAPRLGRGAAWSRWGSKRPRARSRCRARHAGGSASALPFASPGFRLPGCRPCSSGRSRGPISPRASIELTFSKPLHDALGAARPKFSVRVPGRWSESDSHTLVFRPAGFGFPLDASVRLELPRNLSVNLGTSPARTARTIDWKVAGASFLRLQQLLADGGYLPLSWQPAGETPARQLLAEINAAVAPPEGSFSWRYTETHRMSCSACGSPGSRTRSSAGR